MCKIAVRPARVSRICTWLAGFLAVMPLLAGCAHKHDYSVVFQSPALDRTIVATSKVAVVVPEHGPDVTGLVAEIGDPTEYLASFRGRLEASFTGRAACSEPWQIAAAKWSREHIVYCSDAPGFAALSEAVTFQRGDHGILHCEVRDPAAFSGALAGLGCEYALFLEDLSVRTELDPEVLMSSGVPGMTSGLARHPVVVGQFFLCSSEPPELCYSGYVTGSTRTQAGSRYTDEIASMVGQLVRGVLAVR